MEYAFSPLEQLIASSSLLLDHNDIGSSFGNGLYLQPTPGKNMIEPESTEHNWHSYMRVNQSGFDTSKLVFLLVVRKKCGSG